MSNTEVGEMYGFQVPNPPDIQEQGGFINTPTPPQRVTNYTEYISTNASWNHHTGFLDGTHVWGNHWVDKTTILTLDFHWEAICEVTADDIAQKTSIEVTEGNVTTDSETHSFTKTIGAEAGAEGKGMSAKISASLSQTDSREHSVSISKAVTTTREFSCPPHSTIQAWQLVAKFSHTELIPPFDTGHSIDSFTPPYSPGTKVLTVRTPRIVNRSFTR